MTMAATTEPTTAVITTEVYPHLLRRLSGSPHLTCSQRLPAVAARIAFVPLGDGHITLPGLHSSSVQHRPITLALVLAQVHGDLAQEGDLLRLAPRLQKARI